MKAKYAIHEFVTFVGGASATEKTPKALATARAVTVAKNALDDGLIDAPMQIKAQVYPTDDTIGNSNDAREVTVQLNPGCPNHCCTVD
ncbi:hypothetical protein VSR68_42570 [Paraburkholderia phymatum]|uniref:hypothetical protein n=1 Tax=Paraburkholderia phymatum TaxID=148447 RepID=UPI00317A2846